jgi:YD repeat-containing protein
MKRVVLYYIFAAILIVTTVTVTSCKKEEKEEWEECKKLEQNGYSVTVCGGKNGTVSITSEPWKYSDRPSEIITITATANSGYRFLEWQAEWIQKDGITVSINTDNPTTFGMSSDYGTVVWKAIFVPSLVLPKSITVSQYDPVYGNISEIIHTYKYDIQNRLTEGRIYNHFSLNYNEDGDLVGYESCYTQARCYRATFSQNDNKISFATRFRFTASCFIGLGNGELELNAQGLPVKLTYEEVYTYGMDTETKRSTSTVLTLTWHNGNITMKDWKSEIEFERRHWTATESEFEKISDKGTITYTYDDKKTPFYNCNMPKWFFWWLSYFRFDEIYWFNENNVKSETREDGSSKTYEYTYNDNGFPVTRTWAAARIWMDGITTETYTYHK